MDKTYSTRYPKCNPYDPYLLHKFANNSFFCSVENNKLKCIEEKIYHLPMDQQYDKIVIDGKDERYVSTVEEAERLGFRRAYRWKGDLESK